jgi:hypothetical protein
VRITRPIERTAKPPLIGILVSRRQSKAMRQAEIEFWALGIMATVTSGGRVEDSRVELKAEWPDPVKAARRLAGHANAARGEDVLWLLGVDERQGVVGVNPDDLASWWSAVIANFDGPSPSATPVTIFQDSVMVLALLLETVSAPFVVMNPSFGTPNGGPVALEVPWREMTSVRSARHSDLIRLLVPQLRLPSIEVLDASLAGNRYETSSGRVVSDFGAGFRWKVRLTLYVVPHSSGLLIFPAHLVSVTVKEPVALGQISLQFYMARGTIGDSTVDLAIEGPSRVVVEASAEYEGTEAPGNQATLTVRLVPAGSDQKVVITCELEQEVPNVFKLIRSSVSAA